MDVYDHDFSSWSIGKHIDDFRQIDAKLGFDQTSLSKRGRDVISANPTSP